MSRKPDITSILLAALGLIFFIPFLGGVHLFDWDEINFAEISREMLLMEDYFRNIDLRDEHLSTIRRSAEHRDRSILLKSSAKKFSFFDDSR